MFGELIFLLYCVSTMSALSTVQHHKVRPEPLTTPCPNRTCLDIQLVDMYGDGWDGAQLFIETPWDEMFSDAPDCGNHAKSHSFCTDATGNYPMMLIHENESYTPENYWEDLFTVSVSKCDKKIAKYTGGYNTTMIFHYDADLDDWSVLYWENLWENEKACDACGDAKACKPKPRSKSSKKSKKPAISKPIDSAEQTNSTNVKSDKPRYGPPAVNVKMSMFDDKNDGWWQSDYHGASWYLADDRRTTLFQTGSLCNDKGRHGGKSGYCNLCLGDGSYSMRFSGLASDTTSWDFCGVQGGYAQELTFHIKKGKCIPDSLLSLDADCFGNTLSTIHATGLITFAGLTTEFVAASQYAALPGLLSDYVKGWESKNIEVQSSTLTSRMLSSSSSRRLAEFDVDVEFTVSFESEAEYGVEGRFYSNVENLITNLKDSLSGKVSSEGFIVSLKHSVSLSGSSPLEKVQSAELVSLKLDSISYEGVQVMQASSLPAFDDSEYWGNSIRNISLNNVESVSIFFAVMVIGFVAFVGLISHGMNGYTSVSQLSESMHEVAPSEMDTTISNPLASKGLRRNELSASL